MKQIKNVADVLVSTVDKKSYTDQLPVRLINYTDVYYGETLTPADARMKATATRDQLSSFRLRAGDSILTKDSETADDIGVSAYLAESADDVVCGYHLAILRPRVGALPKFLYWCLKSEITRGQFSNSANGMTRYGLTTGSIKSTTVPNPVLKEQRRIADFLDDQVARIDNIIAARRAQSDQQRLLFQSSVFDSVAHLEATWAVTRLGRLIDSIEQGSSPVADGVPAEPDEYGVLMTSAISSGRFLPERNKRITAGFVPGYEIGDGDVVVVRGSGSADLVADVALVGVEKHGPRLMLSDLVYRLNRPSLDRRFLTAVLLTPQLRTQIRAAVRQGSGPAKARGEDILNLQVPVPDKRGQRGFADWYWRGRDQLDEGVGVMDRSIKLFEEMKRSLITAAVTGEFDVSTADGSRVSV